MTSTPTTISLGRDAALALIESALLILDVPPSDGGVEGETARHRIHEAAVAAARALGFDSPHHALGALAPPQIEALPDGVKSQHDIPTCDVSWLMCEAFENRFEPRRQERYRRIALELQERRATAGVAG